MEPQPNVATSAECWLAAGGPHHTVLSRSVGTEKLSDFAAMMGIELVIVDADTTPRQFGNELRWNAAYHHLRLGR